MAAQAPGLIWRRAPAMAALGVILVAMCLGGAQSAAAAGLLAALLALILAIAAMGAAPGALADMIGRNWLPILAAFLFSTFALATAWIGSADATPDFIRTAWHPLWRDLTPGHGAISIAPYRTLEGLIAFFAPAAAFGIGALTVQDRDERRVVSVLLVVVATVFAAASLVWLWTGADGQNRLEARFGSANSAATTFGILAIMLAARVMRIAQRPNPKAMAAAPPRLRWAWVVFVAPATLSVLALTLTCLLLTGSRAGIVATLGAFVLLALLMWTARRHRSEGASFGAHVLIGVVALGLLLFAFGGQMVLGRLLHISEDAGIRQTLVEMHWRIFLERPWLGHGLHTFHELNAHYMTPETWRDASYVGAAHNIFVQALEEVGIIGFALLALMIGPPLLRCGWSAANNRSGAEWSAAAFAATMLALAHGVVDFGIQTPAIAALLMFLLGGFSSGGARARRHSSETTSQAMPAHNSPLTASAMRTER